MREDVGTPERQSQVAEQLVELGESCEKLHKEIELLDAKLVSVLQVPGPGIKECDEKAPGRVGLAQRLNEHVESIRDASRRISDIHQRLEL